MRVLLAATLVLTWSAGCLSDLGSLADRVTDAGQGPPSPTPADRTAGSAGGTLRVHFLSVGQGDATVWELPGGSVVIYDCGGGPEIAGREPINRFLRDTVGLAPGSRIAALIASHGHLDHIRECEEILRDYTVEHLYDTWYRGADGTHAYSDFRDAVRAEGGVIHTIEDDPEIPGDVPFGAGDGIPLPSSAAGVRLQVVWPPDLQGDAWRDIAHSSVVVRLSYGTVDLCLQGDIDDADEAAILSTPLAPECDIYLVGHHGSRHASSTAWLERMDPELAVVSFGPNDYGHPTSEALCRVQSAGARVYATHRLGDVTVETDGTSIVVRPEGPETMDYCRAGADYWSSAPPISAPPAPPTPDAAGPLAVSASITDPQPCQNAEVSVLVHVDDADGYPVAEAQIATAWHYKTTTPTEEARTDAEGDAVVTRSIGGATPGHEVTVEVTATAGDARGTAATTFTPRAC